MDEHQNGEPARRCPTGSRQGPDPGRPGRSASLNQRAAKEQRAVARQLPSRIANIWNKRVLAAAAQTNGAPCCHSDLCKEARVCSRYAQCTFPPGGGRQGKHVRDCYRTNSDQARTLLALAGIARNAHPRIHSAHSGCICASSTPRLSLSPDAPTLPSGTGSRSIASAQARRSKASAPPSRIPVQQPFKERSHVQRTRAHRSHRDP